MTNETRLQRLMGFERNLAHLVEEYTREFQGVVRSLLSSDEQQVYDIAMPLYSQASGRWYDPWGIPDSISDFLTILEKEGQSEHERLKALTVLLFHDCGYPRRDESKDYRTRELRELHMRVGAAKFGQTALGFQKFSRADISEIFDAIIRHDDKFFADKPGNGSLAGPQNAADLLSAFIDGDNIFIPSFISAYKDYVSRSARPMSDDAECRDLCGSEFLQMRQVYFFASEEESRSYGLKLHPSSAIAQKHRKCLLPIRFKATKQVLAAHMYARIEEHDQGLFNAAYEGDWVSFSSFAEDYLNGSIAAAKKGESYDWSRYKNKIQIK